MMAATELELAGELEDELEEEEAELEPVFSRGEASAHRFGQQERGQAVTCPTPAGAVLSGFSRYSNSIPLNERPKVTNIATLVTRSFQPGCTPFVAVRLVGHADYDPFRERREPGYMMKISRARAVAVRQALERLINNRAISSRMTWDVGGVGATALVVPNPRTEAERARNRRVEIWLNGTEPSSPDYIRWVQSCLNTVLGTRLAVSGVMEPKTRSAIRAFQQRQGLAINGIINPQTLAAFINACGFPIVASCANFVALTPTIQTSGETVTYVTEPAAKMGLDLPCKNVDLQTGGCWGSVLRERGGYFPVNIQGDVPAAQALKNGNPGWFFSIPYLDAGLRWMFKNAQKPYGAVINLNPSCFGEVYWVAGTVGGIYMAFAVWLPYARWVAQPTGQETESVLPVVVHFRPDYDLSKYGYGEAAQAAKAQGVPVVLARDRQLVQPFLSAAWYYLLGSIAFVQQMLAVQRLAALVMPIPPPTTGPILHPDAFFQDFRAILTCVVNQAIQLANSTSAGGVSVRNDYFILTANSHGGVYLMNAARRLRQPGLVREIWMFDTDYGTMLEAKNMNGNILRRLYVAQSGNRGQLLTGGQGTQYERQTTEWSAVDITEIPNMGTNLHDYCGRFCFSHAAALSPAMIPLKQNPQLLNKTLQDPQCWADRQEFWMKH